MRHKLDLFVLDVQQRHSGIHQVFQNSEHDRYSAQEWGVGGEPKHVPQLQRQALCLPRGDARPHIRVGLDPGTAATSRFQTMTAVSCRAASGTPAPYDCVSSQLPYYYLILIVPAKICWQKAIQHLRALYIVCPPRRVSRTVSTGPQHLTQRSAR